MGSTLGKFLFGDFVNGGPILSSKLGHVQWGSTGLGGTLILNTYLLGGFQINPADMAAIGFAESVQSSHFVR